MLPQCETERLVAEHLVRQGLAVERGVELVSFLSKSPAESWPRSAAMEKRKSPVRFG